MVVGSNSLPPETLAVGNIATANRAGGSLHNPTVKVLGGRHEHALCSILRSFFGGRECNPITRDLDGRLLYPTADRKSTRLNSSH